MCVCVCEIANSPTHFQMFQSYCLFVGKYTYEQHTYEQHACEQHTCEQHTYTAPSYVVALYTYSLYVCVRERVCVCVCGLVCVCHTHMQKKRLVPPISKRVQTCEPQNHCVFYFGGKLNSEQTATHFNFEMQRTRVHFCVQALTYART